MMSSKIGITLPYELPVTRVAEGRPGLAQGGPRESQDKARATDGCSRKDAFFDFNSPNPDPKGFC